MDLTVLELHLHDAEFNAPFASGRSPRGDAAEASTERAEPSESAPVSDKLGPLAALAAFVGLALLARYLRGGEAERTTEDEVEA